MRPRVGRRRLSHEVSTASPATAANDLRLCSVRLVTGFAPHVSTDHAIGAGTTRSSTSKVIREAGYARGISTLSRCYGDLINSPPHSPRVSDSAEDEWPVLVPSSQALSHVACFGWRNVVKQRCRSLTNKIYKSIGASPGPPLLATPHMLHLPLSPLGLSMLNPRCYPLSPGLSIGRPTKLPLIVFAVHVTGAADALGPLASASDPINTTPERPHCRGQPNQGSCFDFSQTIRGKSATKIEIPSRLLQ